MQKYYLLNKLNLFFIIFTKDMEQFQFFEFFLLFIFSYLKLIDYLN